MPSGEQHNANVEICARSLRQRVPGSEKAAGRAERLTAWAKIESTRPGQEMQALRWAEAAVQLAPWSSESREVLTAVHQALAEVETD